MKIIKQSTYETCLACCLLMILGKNRKNEIEIWKHGWRFNYLIGQLNYVSTLYGQTFDVYIENKYYFSQLEALKNKKVRLYNEKVSSSLLGKLLKKGNVIIYLDNYHLGAVVHAPHFILGLELINGLIKFIDPIDGQIKEISANIINKGINSLRNYLKYSPVLIVLGNK